MSLQSYGYLFGQIKLIKDNHHDEVFIEKTNHVIMENNKWLYNYKELIAIANEILGEQNMNRDEIIGNVTTIGKFLLITFGTPSMVSYANSNEFIILISAIFGLIWAFLDSKYFNTFFNKNKHTCSCNDIDPAGEYEEMLNEQYGELDD